MTRVTLVLGTTTGGTGTHVLLLATGLAAGGTTVAVAAPGAADRRFGFSGVPAVSFTPVEIGDRPRPGDLAVVARLRRLLLRRSHGSVAGTGGVAGTGSGGGGVGRGRPSARDVVHAHGMRAGALTVLALLRAPDGLRPGIVVTVHNAPPGGAAARVVYRLLELVVARGADLVLCVSGDLEKRMRDAGARRTARAVIAAPARTAAAPARRSAGPEDPDDASPGAVRTGRPMVLAVGRLAPQKGHRTLLKAAARWADLEPRPLLVIAGDGPLAAELRASARALGVAAVFTGETADVGALLSGAAVFVLPSRWEGQPLALQEALRAARPVVATRVGGIADLVGEDAALLVGPDDAGALGAAVRSVLTDAPLAARLAAAASQRAAALPSPATATAAALAAYTAIADGPFCDD
jgi:glycosyltransferase involved in cell wall biosynthesis